LNAGKEEENMAITHRERLMAALNHREADRIPIDLGGYPGATSVNIDAYGKLKEHLNLARDKEIRIGNVIMFTAEIDEEVLQRFDIDTINATPSIPLSSFKGPETFYDKYWKITWRKTDVATYSPVDGPFLKEKGTLAALEAFDWPKPAEMEDAKKWKEKVQGLRPRTDRALVARLPLGIVTLTQILRGFEDWFMDLHLNPEFMEALLDKCTENWIESARIVVEAIGNDVDVFAFGDDYGFQTGPMISPEMFRKYVTPRNKKMLESVKAKSKAKILLHSCGCVYPYLEDFLEMGIDALNPIQVSAKDMDPAQIKARIGDRVALWGAIGINDLVKETPRKVKEMVKRRIEQLSKGGGYVLAATHNLLTDVPPENIAAMFDAAAEYGRY
jgi:uroporphyrinogen decarboxylase